MFLAEIDGLGIDGVATRRLLARSEIGNGMEASALRVAMPRVRIYHVRSGRTRYLH